MANPCLLIGDIGGTNARFALADPARLIYSNELAVKCKDYATLVLAIDDYLKSIGEHRKTPVPEVICLGVAGPVIDDSVHFTHNHWHTDCHALHQKFPAARVRLLNDFEAITYAIPFMDEAGLETIGLQSGGVHDKTNYTIGVLGPGTGLGVAGLMGRDGNTYPITGEGGRAGFAPETTLQLKILKQLQQQFEHVSNEHLLSGPGLENIYLAFCSVHGKRAVHLSAREIFRRVLANEDVFAVETLQLFYEALGQVAGNLALTLGANDGIFIVGGIVKRYPDLLKASNFRSAFEHKGCRRSLLERIPTLLVKHPQPGLLGASYCAQQMHQM